MTAQIETWDIVIIGAGPAGIAAAVTADSSGARVLVIDDNPALGGQIWRDGPHAKLPKVAQTWRTALARCQHVTVVNETRVISLPASQKLLLEDPQRAWCVAWKKLILCTGARELLLPFHGWTLPGVTGAGALQALIKGGMPVAGERIVIAGSGPLLLAAAATARMAGAKVVRIAEQASLASLVRFAAQLARWPSKRAQMLSMSPRLLDASYRSSAFVGAAHGAGEQHRVRAATIQYAHRTEEIACDRIACGYGLVPNAQLGQAMGCALVASAPYESPPLRVDQWGATSISGVYAAGECTGIAGSEAALVAGQIAGYAATESRDLAQALFPERARWQAFGTLLARHFALNPALRSLPNADTLVCRCEDVACGELAAHTAWTPAKLATRCGMGACQGRICGAAAQALFDWSMPAPRPPFSPARIGTMAHCTT